MHTAQLQTPPATHHPFTPLRHVPPPRRTRAHKARCLPACHSTILCSLRAEMYDCNASRKPPTQNIDDTNNGAGETKANPKIGEPSSELKPFEGEGRDGRSKMKRSAGSG